MDELVEERPEPVKLLLQLLPLTLGGRQQQLLQFHGEALLGVLLSQLLPFHARRPLVTKNLKFQFFISKISNKMALMILNSYVYCPAFIRRPGIRLTRSPNFDAFSCSFFKSSFKTFF